MQSTTDFMKELWEEWETGDMTFDEYFDRLEQFKMKQDAIKREIVMREKEK